MLITGIGKDEMNGWIDGWMEYGILEYGWTVPILYKGNPLQPLCPSLKPRVMGCRIISYG